MSSPKKRKSRYLIKVILAGDPDCGKSELQKKLGYGFEGENYEIILGVDFSVIEADTSKMQLWQITAQDRFDGVSRIYYRGSSVVGLVYDVTRPETLKNTPYWASRVKNAVPNSPILLIGNKIDLNRNYSTDDLKEVTIEILKDFPHMNKFRQVLAQFQGETGFSHHNDIPIVEVSALKKMNIRIVIDIFEKLAMQYIELRKSRPI